MGTFVRAVSLSFKRTWRTLKWGGVKRLYRLTGWPQIIDEALGDQPTLGPFEVPKPKDLSIPVKGEPFPAEEVLHGTVITAQRWVGVPHGLWVEVDGKSDCIRCYAHGLSEKNNARVMVYFGGDALLITAKGVRYVAPSYQAESPEKVEAEMAEWSRKANIPAIFIARPGLYGSSGDHNKRRQAREIALMNAALDTLKAQHGIASFILAGQSGGGLIVAALLNKRRDIEAAVMTSALVSVKQCSAHWEYQRKIPGRLIYDPDTYYDPLDDIELIPTDPAPQIYVISDPEDMSVPFNTQLRYVRSLRALGLKPQHIFSHAPSPRHHVLSGHGKLVAALIANGATAHRIRAVLHELDWAHLAKESDAAVVRPFRRYTPPYVEAESAICVKISDTPAEPPKRLFVKLPRRRLPPASLTKLMTAIVALDIARKFEKSLTDVITISKVDKVGGSGLNVEAGDQLSLQDVMANLLIPSSNITANAVARTFGQMLIENEGTCQGNASERFLVEMNIKAGDLGMGDTLFKNPSGQPSRGQVTTVTDISVLMAAAMGYEGIIKIWGKANHVMKIMGPKPREKEISSSVKTINDYDLIGAKTGTLLPGYYNVAVLSEAPNGNRIITVILHAPTTIALYGDLRAIVDAVKRGHEWLKT